MFKRLLLLAMGMLLVIPALAQGDPNAPRAAVDAALSAVEAQVGTRATNFTFQFRGETTDSSLGCPLVTGEELPYSTESVQVTVIYPDGTQYNVLTSISGQVVVLCDDKFDAEVLAGQVGAEDRCQATPIQALPAYEAPDITLNGVFTAGIEAYDVFGVSSDGGWYQIVSDIGLGWVESTSVTLTGVCNNLVTTSITNPDIEDNCFVEPQAGFTNVRAAPDTEGDLVGRIYENEIHQATARNTAATWFYIQPVGWVSNTVVFSTGECTNITVNDNAVGIGFIESEDEPFNADTAVILERFACPADFEGYLVPRIVTGESTAQVQAGTVPNTLRGFPSVDDAEAPRLGVIQPQRVIDRVISGPACNQGFVWWLVEIDGAIGWTAESNQSSNDYFLEPTGDAPAPATNLDTIVVSENNRVEAVRYSPDGSRLFAQVTEQGFGDGTVGAVNVYDANTGNSLARIEEPSGISSIDMAIDLNLLFVAAGNGTVTAYDTATLEQVAQVTDTFSVGEGALIEATPDGRNFVVTSCTDSTCSGSEVRVFNTSDGALIASAPFASSVLDMVISDNGATLAVMTLDGVSFHDVITLDTISSWENGEQFPLNSVILNAAGESALFAGCNNADCTEGRIGLLNVADGALLGVVPSHAGEAATITYNPEQSRFVTVEILSNDVIERNAATGEETQRFEPQGIEIVSLDYAPDGRAIAAGTIDGQIIFLTLAN